MSSKITNDTLIICCYAMPGFLLLFNMHNSFFWDTVLYASQHGNFYYQSHFSSLFVPEEMDCGSIPVFGMYLAMAWRIFGRTLEVSHLSMLPFVIGFVWQLQRFVSKFVAHRYIGFAMLLMLADSTILSQVTLVTPDLPLLFFIFLGANAAIENRKSQLTFAIVFLFIINMRGTLAASCLLILDMYTNISFRPKWQQIFISLIKRSVIYLPGLLVFVAYYYYLYLQKGWVIRSEDAPWVISKKTGTHDLLFNIALIGWRLLDYGKIIVWGIAFAFTARFKSRILKLKNTATLLLLLLCLFFIMHVSLLSTNLFANRYFMPFNLCFATLCAAVLFSDMVQEKWRYPIALIWLSVLLSGNFWIYPQKISQGWDSTLAHLPYYNLRHEAIAYLDRQHINFNEVQSFFPNAAIIDKIDLNHDQRHFPDFDGKSDYVFFSNVFNVGDDVQDFIMGHYSAVKQFENKGVFITIYKRRQPISSMR